MEETGKVESQELNRCKKKKKEIRDVNVDFFEGGSKSNVLLNQYFCWKCVLEKHRLVMREALFACKVLRDL